MLTLRSRVVKKLLEKLNEKAQTAILIVEGKRDAEALRPLVNADFFLLQTHKKSLYEIAETIAASYKKAILLLDADPKGKKLTQKMVDNLRKNGVIVDRKFGPKLLRAAKCRTIQGLRRTIIELKNSMGHI